jgi:hypothetical protein
MRSWRISDLAAVLAVALVAAATAAPVGAQGGAAKTVVTGTITMTGVGDSGKTARPAIVIATAGLVVTGYGTSPPPYTLPSTITTGELRMTGTAE